MEQRHFQKKKKKKNCQIWSRNSWKSQRILLFKVIDHPHSCTQPPFPSPYLPKIESLGGGGGYKILLERGDKPEKGGLDVEMGRGVVTFFITLQFKHIYCVCWGE